jgi:6 kDa early secretory antigenic target
MNKLTVQSDDLRQQAHNVQAGATQVNDTLSQLTAQIADLAARWEGGASQAFQMRWQEWQQGAKNVQLAMEHMGQFLSVAAQTYEETEMQIQQQAAGR